MNHKNRFMEMAVPQVRVAGLDGPVSRLGLGTVKFGRTQSLRYSGALRLPTDTELQNLLSISRNAGINLLDTAPSYGVSEERLGLQLKNDRHYWKIIGKAGEIYSSGRTSFDLRPQSIFLSLEQSLARLRTDFLDVFLIHYTTAVSDVLSDDLIDALRHVQDRGMAILVGASTHSTIGGEAAIRNADTILHSASKYAKVDDRVLLASQKFGKPVFVKKGLNSGYVANPEASIRSILAHGGVTSLLVGTTNPRHLRANINAALPAAMA